MTNLDSGLCELMSSCGEGVGNEIFAISGDNVECQFCTKVNPLMQKSRKHDYCKACPQKLIFLIFSTKEAKIYWTD